MPSVRRRRDCAFFSVIRVVSAGCRSRQPVDAGAAGAEFDSRREPMATASREVRLVADLTMHVPRDAAGDLECGAASVLDGVDAVTAVEGVDVTALRPRLNDLEIDATATVAVDAPADGDGDAAGRAALADGFGIHAVERVRVDHAQGGAETPVQEYG